METDFATFYADAAPTLQRLATALTGDAHDAADITHAVFERLLLKWPRLHLDNPLAYARTALVRQVATSRRSGFGKREAPTEEVDQRSVVPDFTGAAVESDRLLSALRTLPPRQRQAVVLRYLEDLSTDESADLMGCTQGTVKRAAHDGLNALRARLGEPAERQGT